MLVVDASVAIKWVVPEQGESERDTDAALALLERGLVAPDLLLSEFGNTMWKKVRRGEIGRKQALDALEVLPAIVSFYPIGIYISKALEIGIALDHPVYDCAYLAVAETHAISFVTADRRLLARCAGTRYDAMVMDLSKMEM